MSVVDDVRALVAEHADVSTVGNDDAMLEIDSLTLVTLIEALEDRFDLRVAPREAVPANFASIAAIARFVAEKTKR